MAYDWRKDLARLEAKYGIPPGLLGALVRAESGGDANARSPAGAIGLTQLMPGTARGLGVNPHDPRQNLEGGAKYLGQQLKRFRSVPHALAAYNAGPGAVQQYGGVPPYKETKQYVERLTGYWKESSRYGTGRTNPTRSSVTPGSSRSVRIQVPDPVSAPVRQFTPGIEAADEARLRDAYRKDPAMAQLIMGNRIRKQNELDTSYASDLTKYEANQRQIAAANAVNNSQILGPNTYKPGTVGEARYVGSVGRWDPNTRFVKAPNGWVRNQGQNEAQWQFLQRIGQRGFGLRNDAGTSQTTGGRHQPGSNHYAGRAVDFGDARNSRQQLIRFAEWARQNAGQIRELYYNPLGWGIRGGKVVQGLTVDGHDDHLHIAR